MLSLQTLEAQLAANRGQRLPVASWNPPLSGDIDIRIARDGRWYHEGDPILREPLVRLFAQWLRREGGDHFLVTPMEKWRIRVDDTPFVAVDCEVVGQGIGEGGRRELLFTTNVGDVVACGPEHPLQVDGDAANGEGVPRIHVRDGLEARISRNLYYRLVERAALRDDGRLVVQAGGCEFCLGRAS